MDSYADVTVMIDYDRVNNRAHVHWKTRKNGLHWGGLAYE